MAAQVVVSQALVVAIMAAVELPVATVVLAAVVAARLGRVRSPIRPSPPAAQAMEP